MREDNSIRVNIDMSVRNEKIIIKKCAVKSYPVSQDFHGLYITAMASSILGRPNEKELIDRIFKMACEICPDLGRNHDREWHYSIGNRAIEVWEKEINKTPLRIK